MSNAELTAVDPQARASAEAALNHVVSVGAALSDTNEELQLLRGELSRMAEELRLRPVVTQQMIADIAWQKAGDRLAADHAALFENELDRRLDFQRPDYDRTLRDWVYEKARAWGLVK